LWWDGAVEIIGGEYSERATLKESNHTHESYCREINRGWIIRDINFFKETKEVGWCQVLIVEQWPDREQLTIGNAQQ